MEVRAKEFDFDQVLSDVQDKVGPVAAVMCCRLNVDMQKHLTLRLA